jgi:hypothetical protein
MRCTLKKQITSRIFTLKANNKSKKKKIMIESPSEEEGNDVLTSNKQDIALKANNKSKKKKIMIESPSEEEDDEEEMSLFIKKFNKFISKKRPFKVDRKEKPRSKNICYNYDKSGYFIAQYPYERKEEDNDKMKKFDKSYKKDKKSTKNKPYRQTHVGQE